MTAVRYLSKLPRLSVMTFCAWGLIAAFTSSKTCFPRASSSSRLALPLLTASRSAFAVVCSIAPTETVARLTTSSRASSSTFRPASSLICAVCSLSLAAPRRM
ncbi:hypothetical protein 2200_scaffold2278_00038 [Bacteriophage sp.]|nr:hypothetical protein 2200_scaffold2278_00038 [Bacteriophage sp.]